MNHFAGIVALLIIIIFTAVHKTEYAAESTPVLCNLPTFDVAKNIIEETITECIPIDFEEPRLQEICAYALRDGKKIRSVITLVVADNELGAYAALGVEYIHAASLILDDIMDKDDVRRGKPTVACRFGVNAAQLAALQLMSTSYVRSHTLIAKLCDKYGPIEGNRIGVEMFGNMACKLKILGLGQYMDMNPHEILEVEDVIHKKTSSLFELAFLNGWLVRNGDVTKIPAVNSVARSFGMLFQIADDVDDFETDLAKNISTVNYVARHGYVEARDKCFELADAVLVGCVTLGIRTTEIEEVLKYLLSQITAKKITDH